MKKLGKYEILEEIGRGGFAVVYKARDTTLNRVVALKVLHPQLTTDPKFVQRFHQEAQTAARLHHPHIVTIHDVGEETGQHYLAMAFLPGRTLDERLSATKGPLPVELAISIVEQIADALGTIHQHGLVHRDVKPANIMVDSRSQVTLLDFGIVRAAEGTRLTTTMAVLGTPEYMAPEQAELQEGVDIDWRADIYALGVVAYEMLVGRPPFTGKSPTAILHKHVYEPPPQPTALNPDLPAGLAPVLLKALAKRREERFQRAGDFAAELRRALLTDSQARQQEEQLAPLYQQLQITAAQGDWRGVLVLGRQIQALDASYQDVPQRMVHARQQLRYPRNEPTQPPPAQPARRKPVLTWCVAGLSVLAVLVCISLVVGSIVCGIIPWPPGSPLDSPTPTRTPTLSLAATNTTASPLPPTDAPTPTLTPTSTPAPTLSPTDTPTLQKPPSDTPIPTLPTDTPTPTKPPTFTPTPTPPTDTPTPDTFPPPIPSPYGPKNGQVLVCRSTQNLVWTPVSDPSDVFYYVKLERQVTASKWESAGGWGPVDDTLIIAAMDCGRDYRWAVRAQDGAGNISNWSEWASFTVSIE